MAIDSFALQMMRKYDGMRLNGGSLKKEMRQDNGIKSWWAVNWSKVEDQSSASVLQETLHLSCVKFIT